jgi:YVTN family beta-propeller protein
VNLLNIKPNRTSTLLRKAFAVFAVVISVMFILNSLTAQAAVPKLINFQGKLTKNSDGTNVVNGNYDMQFKLYDASSGGNLLWTETWNVGTSQVNLSAGVFSVKLGTYTNLDTVDFTNGNIYLTVNFNPGAGFDGEMSPRKRLVSTPFAFNANSAVGDGRLDLTSTSTANAVGRLVYNPSSATTSAAVIISAGANVQGAALNVTQAGSGYAALFNGGNVGIGTTTPAQLLSVAGNMQLTGALFDSNNVSGSLGMILQTTGTGTQWIATSSLGIIGGIQSLNGLSTLSQTFSTSTSGGLDMFITSSGSNHTFTLQPSAGYNIPLTASTTQWSALAGNPVWVVGNGSLYNATSTDNVGIGTTAPSSTLFVQGKAGTNPFAIASSTGTQLVVVNQSGNVGIGTTTPINQLSIFQPMSASSYSQIGVIGSAVSGLWTGYSNVKISQFDTNTQEVWGVNSNVSESISAAQPPGAYAIRGVAHSAKGLAIGGWFSATASGGGLAYGLIVDSGNVGIGTNSPIATLTVMGTSSAPTINPFVVASSTGSQMVTINTAGQIKMGTINVTSSAFGHGLVEVAGGVGLQSGGSVYAAVIGNGTQFQIANNVPISFTSSGVNNTSDLFLYRDGAGSLGVRNALNGQSLRVYNQYGSATNYERGVFSWNNNGLQIGTENSGTGTARSLAFITASTTRMTIDTSGNIGIGTATPTQLLSVAGNMQLTGALFDSNNASGTSGMILQTTGTGTQWVSTSTLGIATNASGTPGAIQFAGAGNTFNANNLFNWDNTNARLGINTTTTVSAISLAQGTTAVSGINFGDATANLYRYTAGGIRSDASILYLPNGTVFANAFAPYSSVSNGYFGSALGDGNSLQVRAGSTGSILFNLNSVEAMRVTSSGNVGIGTSSPIATLTVMGTSSAPTVNPFVVASSSGAHLLTVLANGKVGIGTATPSQALQVVGSVSNVIIGNSNISQVSTASVGSAPYSVYVSGRYAYVANSGSNSLSVIDISNPTAPVQIATTSVGSTPRSVYVSGRYAYVANFGSNTMSVIDISNPAVPVQIATTTVGSMPNSVYVSGRYAYVGNYWGGSVSVVDISNPKAPLVVSTASVPLINGLSPRLNSVYVSGRYAYAAASPGITNLANSVLSVIDISNPYSATTVATTTVGGVFPVSVYVSGRYAYVANSDDNTLSIIDVSNPLVPVVRATTTVGNAPNSVYVSGRYAYVANLASNSISVVDISNPAVPVQIATTTIGTNPQSVYVSGRYAYVANSGSSSLSVVDVSGTETTSLLAHSADIGNLQIRNDVLINGQIQVTGGLSVGQGGIYSAGALAVSATNAPSTILGQLAIGSTSATSMLSLQGMAGIDLLNIASSTGASIFRILANGNLGLGTTTPSQKLVVAGDARITGALFDSNNASGTLGMILQTTGTGTQWVATSTLGFGSSLTGGTTGKLAVWSSPTTLTSGLLLDNGTVAGVNATSSSYTFNVQGSTNVNPFNISSSTGTSLLTVLANGNVGIGTSSPGAKLEVYGGDILNTTSNANYFSRINTNANAADSVNFSGPYDRTFLQFDNSIYGLVDVTTLGMSGRTTLINGNVGIGTTSPSQILDVWGNLNVGTSSTPTLFVNSGTGRVGIGTANPLYSLQVNGSIISNQGNIGYLNSSGNISAQIGGYNGALQLTIGNGTVGTYISSNASSYLNGGNVGIGTTSPSSRLQVVGDIQIGSIATTTSYGLIFNNGVNANTVKIIASSTGSNYTLALPTAQGSANTLLLNDGSGNLSFVSTSTLGFASAATAFIQGGNTFGATGTLGTLDNQSLQFITNNTARMTIASTTGYVGVNNTNPLYNFDVAGTGRVTGNLYVTSILTAPGSSGFNLRGAGGVNTQTGVNIIAASSIINTTGTTNDLGINSTFAPATGNGNYNSIYVVPVINQTGTASGTTRGLYINPTLTSVVDYRALEVATGTSIFMGNVGIGTTSPSQLLTVGNNNQFTVSSAGALVSQSATIGQTSVIPVVVSGATSPTGANGTYTYMGQYNYASLCTKNYYSNGTYYMYSICSGWVISTALGDWSGGGYTVSSSASTPPLTGPWSNLAPYTGTVITSAGSAPLVVIDTAGNLSMGGQLAVTGTGNSYILGNVGIGTATPTQLLSVAGNMRLTGALFDSNNASGTLGMVLQTTGTGTQWVATSTLGISGSTSLSGGTTGKLAVWSSPSALTSGLLMDNGTVSGVNATSSTVAFNIQGTGTIDPLQVGTSTNTGMLIVKGNTGYVGIGTTSPIAKLTINNTYNSGANWTEWRGTDGTLYNYMDNRGTLNIGNGNFIIGGTGTNQSYWFTGGVGDARNNMGAGGNISALALYGHATTLATTSLFDIYNIPGGAKLFSVLKNGNVGIGTTSPIATLSVMGTSSAPTINPFVVASSSGAQLLTVLPGGYVGIGNSNPNYALDVNGTVNATAVVGGSVITSGGTLAYPGFRALGVGGVGMNVFSNGIGLITNSTERVTIDTSGNVGIGTTTPLAKLDINASSSSVGLNITNVNSAGNAYGIKITNVNAGSVSYGVLVSSYVSEAFSAQTDYGRVLSGSSVHGTGINMMSQVGSAAVLSQSSTIDSISTNPAVYVLRDTVLSGYDMTGAVLKVESSVADSGNLLEVVKQASTKFVINSVGKVGIGTTSPIATLTVMGTSSAPTTNPFVVASSTGAQLLTVLPNGNVGIGTTSPSQLLTVGNNNQFTVSSAGVLVSQSATIGASSVPPPIVVSGSGSTPGGSPNGTYTYVGQWNGANEYRRGTDSFYISLDTGTTWCLNNGTLPDCSSSRFQLTGVASPPPLSSSWTALGSFSGSITTTAGSAPLVVIDTVGDLTMGGQLAVTGIGNSYFNGGNVGIGTATPTQTLSVAGNMRLTGALFDSNNASGTLGMVLQSTGTGQQWVATSTLGISGGASLSGGTTGKLAVWSSPTSLTSGLLLDNGTVAGVNATSTSYTFNVQGSTNVNPFNVASSTGTSLFTVLANGNVGIGTSSPVALLHVAGQTVIGSQTTAGSANNIRIMASSTPDAGMLLFGDGTGWKFYIGQNSDNGATKYLTIKDNGYLGIGTSNPGGKLDVMNVANGVSKIGAATTIGGTSGLLLGYNDAGGGTSYDKVGLFYKQMGANGEGELHFALNNLANSGAATIANSVMMINRTGLVGIGTTSPVATLTVMGTSSAPTVNPFVVASSSGANLLVLSPVGNLTGNNNGTISGFWEADTHCAYLGGNSNTVGSCSGFQSYGSYLGNGMLFANYDTYFNTNSIERMRLDSYGNLSIGTTATSSLLTLQGTTSSLSLLNITSSTGASVLYVSNNGNVGIGTTSPTEALTVYKGVPNISTKISASGVVFTRSYDGLEGGSISYTSGNTNIFSDGTVQLYPNNRTALLGWNDGGSTGKVVISSLTTTAGGANLAVAGSAAIGSTYYTSTTTPTNGLIVEGNVGIGTTSPIATLSVMGTTSAPTLNPFVVASSTGAQLLTVLPNGNVGIGTVGPAEALEVNGNIKVGSATTGTIRATNELVLRQDGDTYGPSILRLRNRSGENGAIFETTDPSITLVDFIFKTSVNQRNIRFESRSGSAKVGNPSFHIGGASPDAPTLAVGDSYAAVANKLAIGSYTSPTQTLEVTGSMRLTGAFYDGANSVGTSGMVLQTTGTGTRWVATSTLGISGGSLSGGTTGKLAVWSSPTTLTSGLLLDNGTVAGVNATSTSYTFNVQGSVNVNPFNVSSSTGTSLLTVLANGNVGIGTTTPGYALDVNGGGRMGGLIINGSVIGTQNSISKFSSDLYIEGGTRDVFVRPSAGSNTGLFTFSSTGFTSAGTGNSSIAGNVGIGTTTPINKLSVVGNAQITGISNGLVIASSTGQLSGGGAGVRIASAFPGADCGAKINAASADIGALNAGEIWVDQSCGTTWTTAVVIGGNQVLKFTQGGTYTVSQSITAGHIIGSGKGVPHNVGNSSTIIKQANSANLSAIVIISTTNGSLSDIEIDGNKTNNASAQDNLYITGRGVIVENVYSHFGKRHGAYVKSATALGNEAGLPKFHKFISNQNDGDGLRVESATDAYVSDFSELEDNLGYGIALINAAGSRIVGSDIAKNRLAGVYASGTPAQLTSAYLVISGNQFGNGYAEDIYIDGHSGSTYTSMGNTITGNMFYDGGLRTTATYAAIRLKDSYSNTVTGNSFTSASGFEYKYGIWVDDNGSSLYDTFTGNSFVGSFTSGEILGKTGATYLTGNTTGGNNLQGDTAVSGSLTFGGYLGQSSKPIFISNTGVATAGVTGSLYGFGQSNVAYLGQFDTSGNMGLAGRLSATGNLTVNSSTPLATLSVTGSGSTIPVYIASSTGAALFVVNANGNVGIGTATPAQKLVVAGDARITGALFDTNNASGTSGMILQTTGTGTQWVDTSALGISNLTQSFTATSTITAGDIVNYINGYAQKGFNVSSSTSITLNTPAQFSAGASNISAAKLDATHFVVAYVSSNAGVAVVGTINSDGSITYGSPNTFFNTYSVAQVKVAALDSTHFVVGYFYTNFFYYIDAKVGVVSGNTISSYGAANTVYTGSSVTSDYGLTALDSTHFAVAYYDGTNSGAKVGATSGTTISSYGAANTFLAAASTYISLATLDSTHFVVAYKNNSNQGTAIVGVTSGTTISSYGSANTFLAGTTNNISVSALDSTHFVVGYSDSSNQGTAIVGVTSGTTISSYGSANTFLAATESLNSVTAIDSTHFVVGYKDNNNFGSAILGTVSGTTISGYGTQKTFLSNTANGVSLTPIDDSHYIIAYQDNSNAGQAVYAQNLTTSGNLVGVASASASAGQSVSIITSGVANVFSGLTAGSIYYITTGGVATTTPTSFRLGMAISTTAIQLSQELTNPNQFFGDMIFANNFRITENAGSVQGLLFMSQLNRQILGVSENGDLNVSNMLQAQKIGLGQNSSNSTLAIQSQEGTSPLDILNSTGLQIMHLSDAGDLTLASSSVASFGSITISGNLIQASSSLAQLGTLTLSGNLTALSGNSALNNLSLTGSLSASSSNASFLNLNLGGDLYAAGNVGIGTTTPTQKLVVVGNAQFTGVSSAGIGNDLRITPDGTLTTNTSDASLKTNLTPLQGDEILEKVSQLKPYTFNWINDANGQKDYGFIAQDVAVLFPEITFVNNTDGKMGINYSRMPVILASALQALTQKVNALQGSIMGNATSSQLTVAQAPTYADKIYVKGQMYLSGDSVGLVKILANATSTRVAFSTAYEFQPIAVATAMDFINGQYRVTGVDSMGFIIELEETQTKDVTFSWHAFASETAKLFVSDGTTENIVLVEPATNTPVTIIIVPTSTSTPPVDGGVVAGTSTQATVSPIETGTTTPVVEPTASTTPVAPAEPTPITEPITAPAPVVEPVADPVTPTPVADPVAPVSIVEPVASTPDAPVATQAP